MARPTARLVAPPPHAAVPPKLRQARAMRDLLIADLRPDRRVGLVVRVHTQRVAQAVHVAQAHVLHPHDVILGHMVALVAALAPVAVAGIGRRLGVRDLQRVARGVPVEPRHRALRERRAGWFPPAPPLGPTAAGRRARPPRPPRRAGAPPPRPRSRAPPSARPAARAPTPAQTWRASRPSAPSPGARSAVAWWRRWGRRQWRRPFRGWVGVPRASASRAPRGRAFPTSGAFFCGLAR